MNITPDDAMELPAGQEERRSSRLSEGEDFISVENAENIDVKAAILPLTGLR